MFDHSSMMFPETAYFSGRVVHFETPTQSRTLCRIKALKDFGDVKAGDLGGYIEDYKNLSHDGNCWIYDNAKVMSLSQTIPSFKTTPASQEGPLFVMRHEFITMPLSMTMPLSKTRLAFQEMPKFMNVLPLQGLVKSQTTLKSMALRIFQETLL